MFLKVTFILRFALEKLTAVLRGNTKGKSFEQDIQSCCCVSREPYMTKTCIECLFDLCPCYAPSKCGCFKDIANPMGSCGCQCGSRSLYFPEVEYPCTCFNIEPFYYGSCFGC